MKKLILLFLGLTAATAATAADAQFSRIAALNGIVNQRADYYQIADEVALKDGEYVFQMSSPHYPWHPVYGIANLVKECHEVTVMETYYATPQGSEVWGGVKDAAGNTVAGAKQLVAHPGDSAEAIGRSVKRTGRAVKGFFKGIGKDERSSDGEDLQSGAGNFFSADVARQVAYEMKLDSYTRNPAVRSMLNKIAMKRAAGGAAVGAATSLVPVPVSALTASVASFAINGALTPGAYLEATEELLRDNPPTELYRELEKMLMTLGVAPQDKEILLFRTFCANLNFTPSEKAYIATYLVRLGNLPALSAVLQQLATTAEVGDATTLKLQLQFLSAFNGDKFYLQDYAVGAGNLIGLTTAGEAVLFLPFDYLDDAAANADGLALLRGAVAGKKSVWTLGATSSAFRASLQKIGVAALRENILQYLR
ncbi:hypothetical protein FACS1894139_17430 [Planctomycetales bacterium]|nr:hypothetical protein FACS1894108_13000 [Planctomycetales bacterium]GHT08137.1 hypothetical protein FACS1894139_17430 [Planctomycetales bacterium]